MQKKKVLITGASGFIGRNLFEHFSKREDMEVFGTYNKRKFADTDHLLQADFLGPWGPTNAFDVARDVFGEWDVVIDAAAVSAGVKVFASHPESLFVDSNIMNMRVLEAAFRNKVKHFIFLSCSVMYPMNFGFPAVEDGVYLDKIHPLYRLGALVKLLAEDFCRTYSQKGDTKFTVIRHSNCYGPYDKFDRERGHVFGATVAKVMETPDGGTITVWGNGTERRDFLYVRDLVDFVAGAIETQETPYELCNVGLGFSFSVEEMVQRIVRVSEKKLNVVFDNTMPTIRGSVSLNIEHAKETFGWRPRVSPEKGITRTLEWYKNNIKKEKEDV